MQIEEFYTSQFGEADTPEKKVLKTIVMEIISKWEALRDTETAPVSTNQPNKIPIAAGYRRFVRIDGFINPSYIGLELPINGKAGYYVTKTGEHFPSVMTIIDFCSHKYKEVFE